MLKSLPRKIVYMIGLSMILAGCADLNQYVPAEPPPLTPSQQDKIGTAVEGKLIQMLGGTYYDQALTADLNHMAMALVADNRPFMITIADRSAAALYPLPGGRAIMTRGLLNEVQSHAELESLLIYAEQLAGRIYQKKTTRSMVETTERVLSETEAVYDPESATIRLARLFEQEACEQECLAVAAPRRKMASAAKSPDLPQSIRRLNELQPGYTLLAQAREIENAGNQGKAIATYLQAAAAAPDEPQILRALGLAYLRAGQLQQARLHLQKAVKLQPDYYRSLMGLGYLSLQLGDVQQSSRLLTDSVRLLAIPENLFLLAEVREKTGDAKGAMALYQLVVEADPSGKLGQTSASRLADAAGNR